MTEPIKRRRWFRFSLRMMLVVVTVLCVWLAFTVNAARRQREIVKAVMKAGGSVCYDYQAALTEDTDTPNFDPTAKARLDWLAKLVGDDLLFDVVAINLDGCTVAQSELEQIVSLPCLLRLDLGAVMLVRSGSNDVSAIRDSDLQYLGELSRLTELTFTGDAEINGSGLVSLQKLKHLRLLGLNQAAIDDAGIEQIGLIKPLRYLDIGETRVTNEGLKRLHGLNDLRRLTLFGTAISDDGVKQISALRSLTQVDLDRARVTDVGLQHLTASRQLEYLRLTRTATTPSGIRQLKTALPNCTITGP